MNIYDQLIRPLIPKSVAQAVNAKEGNRWLRLSLRGLSANCYIYYGCSVWESDNRCRPV